MSVQINYKKALPKNNMSNIVFFVNEKFNISGLKNHIIIKEYSYIADLLKTKNTRNKIITFDINSKKKIILVALKEKLTNSDAEKLGAKFYDLFKDVKPYNYNINTDSLSNKHKNFVGSFLHGLKLKSYRFDKYKTKKNTNNISVILSGKHKPTSKDQIKFKAIENGTFYTRDLVSEPGNILHPDEYAKRLNSLKKDGLKVNVYDEKKLRKLV